MTINTDASEKDTLWGSLGTPHHHIALFLSDSVAAMVGSPSSRKKKGEKKEVQLTAIRLQSKRSRRSFALVTPVEQELTK